MAKELEKARLAMGGLPPPNPKKPSLKSKTLSDGITITNEEELPRGSGFSRRPFGRPIN